MPDLFVEGLANLIRSHIDRSLEKYCDKGAKPEHAKIILDGIDKFLHNRDDIDDVIKQIRNEFGINIQALLLELAYKRQKNTPEGYKNIVDYHDGVYECDHVSPYTKSAGNVDTRYFIVLQDWSSDKILQGPISQDLVVYGYETKLQTNKNLHALIKKHFRVKLSDTYATCLFPFIKSGNISMAIPLEHLVDAAKEYAIPQIEIVNPELVILIGHQVYFAMCIALGIKPKEKISQAIQAPFKLDGITYWAQSHLGSRGTLDRTSEQVQLDWAEMAKNFS